MTAHFRNGSPGNILVGIRHMLNCMVYGDVSWLSFRFYTWSMDTKGVRGDGDEGSERGWRRRE